MLVAEGKASSRPTKVSPRYLNAINGLGGPRPWKVSFSYGRALQDPALDAWHGWDENLSAGQRALLPAGPFKRGGKCREVQG
jgi:fructose-bisphosphate aldolase class 1